MVKDERSRALNARNAKRKIVIESLDVTAPKLTGRAPAHCQCLSSAAWFSWRTLPRLTLLHNSDCLGRVVRKHLPVLSNPLLIIARYCLRIGTFGYVIRY